MKSKIFCTVVALAVMFGACNKDSSTPETGGDDEYDVSLKGYHKLDPAGELGDLGQWGVFLEGSPIAFTWNAITASDFAKGQTQPFNNWSKQLGDGFVVYRIPEKGNTIEDPRVGGGGKKGIEYLNYRQETKKQDFGNGNDPVLIWFDLPEVLKQLKAREIGLDASVTVLVRYRASNNVAFKFNIFRAAAWCALKGPISLDYKALDPAKDLGEVTQVRLEAPQKEKPPVDTPYTICLFDSDVCVTIEDCDHIVTQEDLAALYSAVVGEGFDPDVSYIEIVGWNIVNDKGEIISELKLPDQYCDGLLLKPIFEITIDVCVTVGEVTDCESFSRVDGCPIVPEDGLDRLQAIVEANLLPGQKFVGWDYASVTDGERQGHFVFGGSYCTHLTLYPIIANFEEYGVGSYVTETCGSNVHVAIVTFVKIFDIPEANEYIEARIIWGGSLSDETNNPARVDINANFSIDGEMNPDSGGCGTYGTGQNKTEAFVYFTFKDGEFEDDWKAEVEVSGNKLKKFVLVN